jgi:hypothetical protein
MKYRYEFATLDGRSCCKSDDIKYLCDHCKAAAKQTSDALARRLQGYGSIVVDAPLPYGEIRTAAHVDDKRLAEMARFRQQVYETSSVSRAAAAQPTTSKVHLEPPKPYDIAIERRRSG